MKRLIQRPFRWEYTWLCLLVLLTLAMHFAIVNSPGELILDELHYVTDARSIIHGDGSARAEHPSLGKLFIVSGIKVFGDNPLGWRFFPIIFGVASIVFFYFICRRLAMSREAAYFATFLLTLENMTFVQASVAMLDVFTLTFMLACFWLYLRGSYLLAGVVAGLCAQTKLTGILIVLAILIHWLIVRRDRRWFFAGAVLLVPITFLELMPLFDYFIYGYPTNPIERIKTMLSLSSGLTFVSAAHPYMSRPWIWVLRPDIMPYWYQPNYLSAISFSVMVLIIPTVIYLIFKAVRGNAAGLFAISWFAGTYLVWIPLSIITNRISFVYYFYPTVGVICIGLGLGLSQLTGLWRTRKTGKLRWLAISVVTGYLVIHVAIFAILSPLSGFPWFWVPFLHT